MRPFAPPLLPPQTQALLRRPVRIALLLALVAGCALPESGPRSTAIVEAAAAENRFLLVAVDDAVIRKLAPAPAMPGTALSTLPSPPPAQATGIGDSLDIRIFEAEVGGLFASGKGAAGSADFRNVVIGQDGRISLPYLGPLEVAGKTPAEIEAMILAALSGKAVEPQVLVTLARSENNRATVTGDVARSGPLPLPLRGQRLSQLIADAGGSRSPAHQTQVTLIRDGRATERRLSAILLDPANDIAVQRDDLVVLTFAPPRYAISGAVTNPGTYDLPAADPSLLQALAMAGGLNDSRADPMGVFLFREETRARIEGAGLTVPPGLAPLSRGYPTVYRFDLSDPGTQFLAQAFKLSDGDAIYVANSNTIQLSKLLSLFQKTVAATGSVENIAD